ncbi:Cys-Cys-COOH (seleno)protein SaoC [Maridesulfovibrio frigidus]|uniref:Cys-Cys-COOH (seleno)protein SaoC n=1 Tax=Maridesulfovibrio frigidus TaxID=340956 RepID=UPI0006898C04|nr:Cys-Cys-COOH (seleno)protein SaoC [Maridesulfovibrio frigidus]
MRNAYILFAELLVLSVLCCGCENIQKTPKDVAEGLTQCTDIYDVFFQKNPKCTPILATEGDVNDDGDADLVLLYVGVDCNNWMCVLLRDKDGGYTASKTHKAPVSNQSVIFRNIDGKPPLEFIVQGMKGAKSGFAIYRMENGELMDVFGEGMEDCC